MSCVLEQPTCQFYLSLSFVYLLSQLVSFSCPCRLPICSSFVVAASQILSYCSQMPSSLIDFDFLCTCFEILRYNEIYSREISECVYRAYGEGTPWERVFSCGWSFDCQCDAYGRNQPDQSHRSLSLILHRSCDSFVLEQTIYVFDRSYEER